MCFSQGRVSSHLSLEVCAEGYVIVNKEKAIYHKNPAMHNFYFCIVDLGFEQTDKVHVLLLSNPCSNKCTMVACIYDVKI